MSSLHLEIPCSLEKIGILQPEGRSNLTQIVRPLCNMAFNELLSSEMKATPVEPFGGN